MFKWFKPSTHLEQTNLHYTPMMHRRRFLHATGGVMGILISPFSLAIDSSPLPTQLLAVRVWPAKDYTRVTLEGKQELRFTHMLLNNPPRLVVDLEGVEFNSVIAGLPEKITHDDPYIKLIRAGRNRPGVVRLVVELKSEIKPQLFALKPVADYGHRLVMDLYPNTPVDPLLALVDKPELPAPAEPSIDWLLQEPEEIASQEEHKEEPRETQKGNKKKIEIVEVAPEKHSSKSKVQPTVTRMVTIALDPGHGGEDPGAVGRRGTYEKHVTLAIARRLKAKIDAVPNMRAMLTRDDDFFVPLGQRVNKARRVQADLFVSIHADAFVKPTARGSSVFVLSDHGATSTAARWLAQKENASDLIGGANIGVKDAALARTLLDLSQTATLSDSMKVGKAVLEQLGGINDLHRGQIEQAGFAVLKAPDIPSILVETAFISNPDEEKRLVDDKYQDQMAAAILRGIRAYFAKNPPLAKSRLALLD